MLQRNTLYTAGLDVRLCQSLKSVCSLMPPAPTATENKLFTAGLDVKSYHYMKHVCTLMRSLLQKNIFKLLARLKIMPVTETCR